MKNLCLEDLRFIALKDTTIKIASDGKVDNMFVLSMNSKTHTADLSAFLHKHLDDATKKEHDELIEKTIKAAEEDPRVNEIYAVLVQ